MLLLIAYAQNLLTHMLTYQDGLEIQNPWANPVNYVRMARLPEDDFSHQRKASSDGYGGTTPEPSLLADATLENHCTRQTQSS